MYRRIHRYQGFSLIEVLLALFVLGIALGPVIQVFSRIIAGQQRLRDAIAADYAAELAIFEVHRKGGSGTSAAGSVNTWSGRWQWQLIQVKSEISGVRQIQLSLLGPADKTAMRLTQIMRPNE